VILAAWSRDGEIAVQVVDAGKISAALVRPEAASPAVPVADSTGFWASAFSPQGLLVGMKNGHLWLYSPHAKDARPTELLTTSATETQPMWSPDGRWLAYTSNSTGRLEVHLRPFPGPGEAITVSTSGGSSPAWNPNGRELFYIEPGQEQDRMMAVSLAAPGRPNRATALFSFARGGLLLGAAVLTPYAVAQDGQRFYAVRRLRRTSTPVTQVNLILNWFEELKAKAPARR
jgi:dipeptidyl aminopeptidase/acylaminoacyl peptidase